MFEAWVNVERDGPSRFMPKRVGTALQKVSL